MEIKIVEDCWLQSTDKVYVHLNPQPSTKRYYEIHIPPTERLTALHKEQLMDGVSKLFEIAYKGNQEKIGTIVVPYDRQHKGSPSRVKEKIKEEREVWEKYFPNYNIAFHTYEGEYHPIQIISNK